MVKVVPITVEVDSFIRIVRQIEVNAHMIVNKDDLAELLERSY